MLPPEAIAELRVKHLEMIQAVVGRMASYGTSLKGLCITLATAVCGFGVSLHKPLLIALAFVPLTAFALLDARYLTVERRLRKLFDKVRQEDWEKMSSFEISLSAAPPVKFVDVVRSWSIAGFYLPLAGVLLLAMLGVRLSGPI